MTLRALPLLALLLACEGGSPSGQGGPGGPASRVYSGKDDPERLGRALSELPARSLSVAARKNLEQRGGKVLVDRRAANANLEGLDVIELGASPELQKALWGGDESAAAAALAQAGVRSLVLQADAAPSLSLSRRVLSRLYHHDHLDYFALFRLGEGGVLCYELRPAPVGMAGPLATLALQYVQHRLEGKPGPRSLPPLDNGGLPWSFVGLLRGQGRELVAASAESADLKEALDALVAGLARGHRQQVEGLGFPALPEHMGSLRLEMVRITERAALELRDPDQLGAFWEPGVDGLSLRREGHLRVLPGGVALGRGWSDGRRFLVGAGLSDPEESQALAELLRGQHFAAQAEVGTVPLYRGGSLVQAAQVTAPAVRRWAEEAGTWYLNGAAHNGQMLQGYDPVLNQVPDGYALADHGQSLWGLSALLPLAPEPLPLRRISLAMKIWARGLPVDLLSRVYLPSPVGIYSPARLDDLSWQLMAELELSGQADEQLVDGQIEAMGARLLALLNPDGTFRAGESSGPALGTEAAQARAALALLQLGARGEPERWTAGLPAWWARVGPVLRGALQRRRADQPWPIGTYSREDWELLLDLSPWIPAAALAQARIKPEGEALELGLEAARFLAKDAQYDEASASFPDYLGAFHDPRQGALPGDRSMAPLLGVASAWRLAALARPEAAPPFEKATRLGLRFALNLTYDDYSTYASSRPEVVHGALRRGLTDPQVQGGELALGLHAARLWLEGVAADPTIGPEVKAGPLTPGQKRLVELETRDRAAAEKEGRPWSPPHQRGEELPWELIAAAVDPAAPPTPPAEQVASPPGESTESPAEIGISP